MILLESPLVKVELDKTVPCVMWTPFGYMTGDDFRDPISLTLDCFVKNIKEFPALGWIYNSHLCKAVRPDDILWVVQNINSAFVQAGGKKIAIIFPEDAFAKIGLRLFLMYTKKSTEHALQVKVFKTTENAQSWIRGVDASLLDEVKI